MSLGTATGKRNTVEIIAREIAGSGNTVDAGSGNNRISDAGSNNTIVMPSTGMDDVLAR